MAGGIISLQQHLGRVAGSSIELRQAFSWTGIANSAANVLGPVTTGLLIDRFGFRAAFGALALLPLVTWWFSRKAQAVSIPERRVSRKGVAWDLLAEPRIRRLFLVNCFMTASWDCHGFMVPMLGLERGYAASAIGGILGIFAVCTALIRTMTSFLARALPEWKLITLAIGTAGLLLTLYPFSYSVVTMGLCSALLGIALGSVQPLVLSLLYEMTPNNRHGEALAIRLMMVSGSALSMPLLLGAAGGVIGLSGVFWILGTVVMAGSTLGLKLRGHGLILTDT